MKIFFMTGTDTDCGKTYSTCRLIQFLKSHNQKVHAIKPIASGCFEQEDGRLVSEDERQLQDALGLARSCSLSQWRYQPPISPHLAAKQAGESITVDKLLQFCAQASSISTDYLLVEGAGGLMVPLNDQATWVDFLIASQIPVILVVGMRLGCLNHALLTESVMRSNHIHIAGWIANCLDQNMRALSQNIETLKEKMKMPLLGSISFEGEYQDDCLLNVCSL